MEGSMRILGRVARPHLRSCRSGTAWPPRRDLETAPGGEKPRREVSINDTDLFEHVGERELEASVIAVLARHLGKSSFHGTTLGAEAENDRKSTNCAKSHALGCERKRRMRASGIGTGLARR